MANGANLAAFINAAGSLLGGLAPTLTNHSTASTAIEGFLTEITAQINDPVAVAAGANGILMTPNVPVDIAMMARQIQVNATNPNIILGLTGRISAVLASSNASIFSHITSYVAPTLTAPGSVTLG